MKNLRGPNTPLGDYTDRDPMGLSQYNNLGEYCNPRTTSPGFLIIVLPVPPLRIPPFLMSIQVSVCDLVVTSSCDPPLCAVCDSTPTRTTGVAGSAGVRYKGRGGAQVGGGGGTASSKVASHCQTTTLAFQGCPPLNFL